MIKKRSMIDGITAYIKRLYSLLIRANYHEYPVYDDKGKIIGHEFFTTRGGICIQKKDNVKDDNDK